MSVTIQNVDMPVHAARMTGARARLLMCPPTLYDVDYVINPWMAGNVHGASRARAEQQWRELHGAISQIAEVLLIEPEAGSPDMVFTANAGLEHNGCVALSSFFHVQRQGEERHFRRWFEGRGYTTLEFPRDMPFEGEGDALFCADLGRRSPRLWIGEGPRTSAASHDLLRSAWPDVEVVPLRLVDPRFYHLDTCFAPLPDGTAMYFAGAFDGSSLRRLEGYYPPAKRLLVDEVDAVRFACNAVTIDRTIILNRISRSLSEQLAALGFDVIPVDLSEFLKAGGAAKCLVMTLRH